MTVIPEGPTTTPAEQLAAAEEEAEQEIAALITGLVATGVTAAAILALLFAFTGVVSAGARAGWAVGARIALVRAAGRRRRARRDRFRVEALPTGVEQDVAVVLPDVARRVDVALAAQEGAARAEGDVRRGQAPVPGVFPQGQAPAGGAATQGQSTTVGTSAGSGRGSAAVGSVEVEVGRLQRRMTVLAVTKIHQAASASTYSYARWLGLDLEWVTRRDGRACAVCAAMHGRRASAGSKFALPRGPGIPRRLWGGFQGLPPTHPNCRCRLVPRPPRE